MYEVGFSTVDITLFEHDMAMLGWGNRRNRVHGVAAPLHARTMLIHDLSTGRRAAYVSLELLLVTQALQLQVADVLAEEHPEWGLDLHNVILTATHTHSGPSGFSHHFWINLGSPGFSPKVFEGLTQAVVDGIRKAHAALAPASLRLSRGDVALSEGVVFNRSTRSYNANSDVEPVSFERRDEAVDSVMMVLRAEHPDGRLAGMLNWFPVHCTSVHSDNHLLHPDNKGLASVSFERDAKVPCAIFAQEAAGDITPNYRPAPARGLVIGKFDNDIESAEYVGRVQARRAGQLVAEPGHPIDGPLEIVTRFVDFSCAPVDPRFAAGRSGRTTGPAVIGLAMAKGTAEGPGPLLNSRWVDGLSGARRFSDRLRAGLRRQRRDDPKVPLVDLGRGLDGRLAGLFSLRRFRLPAVDPTLRYVKQTIRAGGVGDGPWIPQVLPLQLLRIGPLAIATLPFEITTVAGRRLRQTLLDSLAPRGVETVVLNPYANAYAGYITTFEEYQCQAYEGGYTLFGPWSLAALRTAFAALADELQETTGLFGPTPGRVAPEVLEHSRFETPWPDRPFGRPESPDK